MTPANQLTPEQNSQNMMNALVGLTMALKNMTVVHLSPARSVNLSNVCAYEMREKAKLDKNGEPVLDDMREVVGSGEFFPVILMIGGAECELSEERVDGADSENEVFRKSWELFASLNAQAMAIIKAVFPEPPADALGM